MSSNTAPNTVEPTPKYAILCLRYWLAVLHCAELRGDLTPAQRHEALTVLAGTGELTGALDAGLESPESSAAWLAEWQG